MFSRTDKGLPQPVPGAPRTRSKMSWHLRMPARATKSTALKNHFVAAVGEYVGTTLFLFFAFGGTNVANIPSVSITNDVNTSQLLYISLCFGFSLAVNAWVFFRISGGLFNPAVSWGLAIVGAITPVRAIILTVAQILGGITGAAIIDAVLPGSLNVRTTLSPGTSIAQGLFLEMFLTSMLVLTIFMLAAEKHKATFLAPIGIGLALFIAELVGVYYTGGSLNPARSFGPDVVLKQFASYHWIYWVGPFLGSTLAAGFYRFIKLMSYQNAVPDQDADTAAAVAAAAATAPMLPNVSEKVASGQYGSRPIGSRRVTALSQAPAAAPVDDSNLVDTQGPGIGDFLTAPVAAPAGPTVFDLPTGNGVSSELQIENSVRLEQLEQKLDLLLGHILGTSSGHSSPLHGAPRVSVHKDAMDPGLLEAMHDGGMSSNDYAHGGVAAAGPRSTEDIVHHVPERGAHFVDNREDYGDHGADVYKLGRPSQ